MGDLKSGTVTTGSYKLLDLQNSMSVSVTSDVGAPTAADLHIDLFEATSTPSHFPLLPYFIGSVCQFTVGSSGNNINYAFQNGSKYALKLRITVGTTISQKTISFTYFATPTTISSFSVTNSGNESSNDALDANVSLQSIHGTPSKVQFLFDELDTVGAGASDKNEESLSVWQPESPYETDNTYNTGVNSLANDRAYRVTALAKWDTGYSTFLNATDDLLMIAKPVITADAKQPNIQTDIGVGEDVALTVKLGSVLSTLYYNPTKVQFLIYNGTALVASTAVQPIVTYGADKIFTFKISEIAIVNGEELENSTQYTLNAKFTTIEHTTETRTSAGVPIMFTKDAIPLTAPIIDNTWSLASGGDPSAVGEETNFGLSPVIGISGYFSKTVQFDNTRNVNLESVNTKFLIEYSRDAGTSWSPVKRCALVQGSKPVDGAAAEAVNKAGAIQARDAVIAETLSGQYANVEGINKMFFYIPRVQVVGITPLGSVQSDDELEQSDDVLVRVSIIADTTIWGVKVDGNPSSSLEMVNKIRVYDFVNGEVSEPFNSTGDRLRLTVNGVQSSVEATGVASDSSLSAYTITDSGFVVDTTGNVAVSGSMPKVNFYYYVNPTPLDLTKSFKVSELTGLCAYAIIDMKTGSKRFPFFMTYTAYSGERVDNNAGWYKSKLMHGSVNGVYDSVGLNLIYTGVDDLSFRPDITRRHKFVLKTDPYTSATKNSLGFPGVQDERTFMISLHTSSAGIPTDPLLAGDFQFTLLEAGVDVARVGTGSELSPYGIDMSFSNLLLNVPVVTTDDYAYASRVKIGSAAAVEQLTSVVPPPSFSVIPVASTPLGYTVAYAITDPNKSAVVWGPAVSKSVPNKYFPVKEDYTVSNFSFNTFNDSAESSIKFDLTLNPVAGAVDRIDGVNVYITPKGTSQRSKIGSIVTSGNNKTLSILSAIGGDIAGNAGKKWADWDSATISFVAFRDKRVNSISRQDESSWSETTKIIDNVPLIAAVDDIELEGGIVGKDTKLRWTAGLSQYKVSVGGVDDKASGMILPIAAANSPNTIAVVRYFVGASGRFESVSKSVTFTSASVAEDTAVTVDTPNSTKSSLSAKRSTPVSVGSPNVAYALMGNGVNLGAIDTTDSAFAISALLTKLHVAVTAGVQYQVAGATAVASIGVAMDPLLGAYYVPRASTDGDIKLLGGVIGSATSLAWISDSRGVTYDIAVGTSSASNVSTASFVLTDVLTVSPAAYTITITKKFTDAESVYWLSDVDTVTFTSSNASGVGAVEVIRPSDATKLYKSGSAALQINSVSKDPVTGGYYDISAYALGALLSLQEQANASVKFSVNGATERDSDPVSILGNVTEYRVSSVPHVTVNGNGKTPLSFDLNLDANGLEVEGFISLVLVLTQDGTPAKPEGNEVLLQFPVPSILVPTDMDQTIGPNGPLIGGAAISDVSPINAGIGFPTSTLQYSLAIGAAANPTGSPVGRYAKSTLTLPAGSGFVAGAEINVMAILSSRRGTDIDVGSVTLPAV